MKLLKKVVYAAAAGYVATTALRTVLVVLKKRRFPKRDEPDFSKVSVIQPIVSGDAHLEEYLESNLSVLPEAKFVWAVDENDEEAQRITHGIRNRSIGTDVEVVVCPEAPDQVSPKSFKLGIASRGRSGTFLFMDDDAIMSREAASAIVGSLKDADAASAFPAFDNGKNFPSQLFAQMLNNSAIFRLLPISYVAEATSVVGLAYAITSLTLESVGGYEAIESHLGDDVAMARQLKEHSLRIESVPYPVFTGVDIPDMQNYASMIHRWLRGGLASSGSKTLRVRAYGTLFLDFPIGCLVVCIAGAMLSSRSDRPQRLAIVSGLLTYRAVTLSTVQYWLTGKASYIPGLSLLADLLAPLQMLHAALRPHVTWRAGRKFHYRLDGTFTEILPNSTCPACNESPARPVTQQLTPSRAQKMTAAGIPPVG